MMLRFLLRAACCLAFSVLAGCNHGAQPGSHVAAPQISNTDSHKSPAGAGWLTLDFPTHPRQLDPIPFKVTYTDAAGKPVRGASVVLDLSMPDMAMPENKVVCKETGPGVYEGSGHFTMAGRWKIDVTAKQSGIPPMRQSIDPIAVE